MKGYNMLGSVRVALMAALLAVVGLVAFAGPASASTTLSSCLPNTATGSFTVTPAISHTNGNITPSTISLMATLSGCTGKVTGGSTSASLTTVDPTTGQPGPVSCAYFLSPPPAGTSLAKGTFSTTWSNGKTSTGEAKLKSSGTVGELKLVERVTAGYGFLPGQITKVNGTIKFTGTNGNCVNTDISMVNFTNVTTVTFIRG